MIFDRLSDKLFEKIDQLSGWGTRNKQFLKRARVIAIAMLLGLAFALVLLALFALNAFLITGILTLSTPVLIIGTIMAAYIVPCSGFAAAYLTSFGSWFKDQEEPEPVVEPNNPIDAETDANAKGALTTAAQALETAAGTIKTTVGGAVESSLEFAQNRASTIRQAKNVLGGWEEFKHNPIKYIKNYLWSLILPTLKRLKIICIAAFVVTTVIFALTLVGLIPGGLLGFLVVAIPVGIITWLAGLQITYLLKDVTIASVFTKITNSLTVATSALSSKDNLPQWPCAQTPTTAASATATTTSLATSADDLAQTQVIQELTAVQPQLETNT